MKKGWEITLKAVGGAAALTALTAFAVAPGRADDAQKMPFLGRNYAHRGLHKMDKSVPENSLAAFCNAVDRGYGIELDVHLTADDRLVVFHDDTLERMCDAEGCIEDWSFDELRQLRLAGTEEQIPLLSEVLAVVDGRVPIVLEIKRGRRNRRLCRLVYEAVKEYGGDVCVESFDPLIVRWWRLNAPEVLRGQLSCRVEKFSGQTSRLNAVILANLLTNFLGRPQFIAYGLCERKPLTVRLCEAMGAIRTAWTSRSWAAEEANDMVIFEFYRPRVKYR